MHLLLAHLCSPITAYGWQITYLDGCLSLFLPGVFLELLAVSSGLVWFGNSCDIIRKLKVCERVHLSVCEIKRYMCLNVPPESNLSFPICMRCTCLDTCDMESFAAPLVKCWQGEECRLATKVRTRGVWGVTSCILNQLHHHEKQEM